MIIDSSGRPSAVDLVRPEVAPDDMAVISNSSGQAQDGSIAGHEVRHAHRSSEFVVSVLHSLCIYICFCLYPLIFFLFVTLIYSIWSDWRSTVDRRSKGSF